MNKEEFYKHLESKKDPSDEITLECLQYFLDNYPVQIDQVINTRMGSIKTGRKMWTKLDVDLKKIKPGDLYTDFKKLQDRYKAGDFNNENLKLIK